MQAGQPQNYTLTLGSKTSGRCKEGHHCAEERGCDGSADGTFQRGKGSTVPGSPGKALPLRRSRGLERAGSDGTEGTEGALLCVGFASEGERCWIFCISSMRNLICCDDSRRFGSI